MTAGQDERTLRPVADLDPEEAVRAALRRNGVGPGGPDLAAPPVPTYAPGEQPEPEQVEQPADDERRGLPVHWRMRFPWGPKPEQDSDDEPDDVDEAPARAANDRLPDWRDANKPDLAELDEDQEDEPEDEQPKARGPRSARRPVSKTDSSDDEPDEDDDQDEDETAEEQPRRRRWTRPALGRPPGLPEQKHNIFTWWHGIEPYQKWLAYHATGLAGGIYLGAFSYGFEGADFVKTNDPDDINVLATYGLGVLVLVLDYRLRNANFLLAWIARGLSTSVALGALWHSTPLADLGH